MSNETKETFKVLIELNPELEANDLDFLNLFLESKKQSGGGDMLKSKLSDDSTSITVFYEEKEAQQRILDKKFLAFKTYQMRSSQNGFMQQDYELNKKQIMINNLGINDEFFVKIYAENLLPFNQVAEIKQSNIFADTFIITYSDDIQTDLLNERFKARCLNKNNQINLFDTFETNLHVLKSNKTIDIQSLKNEIEKKQSDLFFLKQVNKYVLCQFSQMIHLNELIADYLNQNMITCEFCYNFKLINLPEKITKTIVKSIQSVNGDSRRESCSNELITDDSLELSANDTLVDAILNARQLFINFDEILKKIDKNLTMKPTQHNKSLLIRNLNPVDTTWKLKVNNELKKYFSTRALHKIVKIPIELQANKANLEVLRLKLSKINKECPALYFRIDSSGDLNCHGTRNALMNKIEQLPDLFKSAFKTEPNQPLTEASSLVFELDMNSLMHKALLNIQQIYFDFKNNLKDFNADLNRDDLKKKITIRGNDLDNVVWLNRIKTLIDDYEKNRLRHKKISIPINLKRQKEMDDLKKHCDHFFSKEKTIKYEVKSNELVNVFGYAAQVKIFSDNIQSKFGNLENNIKDRIRRKLDVKLEPHRITLLTMLTNAPNGNHFKEFNTQLSRLEAIAELIPQTSRNGAICIRIKCNMNQNKSQNEQLVEQWRAKIDSFVGNFFSMFITKRQKVSFKKGDFNLDDLNKQVKINWIDADVIELTGLKADVDKLITDISMFRNENKHIKRTSISQSSNKENSMPRSLDIEKTSKQQEPLIKDTAEETFLISDLKWFQTRMLFEKKYFLFITEMYKDLSVLVDTQLTRIFYTGRKKDIEEAKKLALDILDQILGTEVESNEANNEKLILNEQKLANLVKQNGLCCIVDTKSHTDKYTIYATTYEEIERCRVLLTTTTF